MPNKTAETYGLLWKSSDCISPQERWHFNAMQEVIGEPIVRGKSGIEIGSGCGYDTFIMARSNPGVRIISIDISDGIYETKKRTIGLSNVSLVRASALDVPVGEGVFDFAYSFGVLHHTPDPQKGLREIARVIRKGAPAFLYLYEDHSENPVKYFFVSIVRWVRMITVRLPRGILYFLSWLVSPFVFLMFTVPAKIMSKFDATRGIAEKMPFNFGTGPFSLRGDIYDRFGAPIEYRFSRKAVTKMFDDCGFSGVHVTRLHKTAGWVIWGYKK